MTLSTEVYIHDKVDAREVYDHCNVLIGAPSTVRFTEDEDGIWNAIDQGLCALLSVKRSNNEAETCDEWCDADCSGKYHDPAHWVMVDFDTAYGFNAGGEGPGDLHARLVASLGKWLDERGLSWSWRNESTGEVHQSYDGLGGLASAGAAAQEWFRTIVVPAIAAEAAATGAVMRLS